MGLNVSPPIRSRLGKAGGHRLYCDRFRAAFTGGNNGPGTGF
jgi:hypothetical protein